MPIENEGTPNQSILNTEVAPPAGGEGTPPADTTPRFVDDGWLKGVELDVANDPSMKAIKDLQGLAKSYVHAQRMVGKERVLLPNEKATDQEWKNFFSKIGLPEEKDYQLGIDDKASALGKEVIDEFKKLAYAQNLLPKQATEVLKYIDGKLKAKNEASVAQEAEAIKAEIDGLKQEWGDAFPNKLKHCQRVVSMFGDEGFQKYLDESGLGNDTKFIKFINKIGESLHEDKFKTETVGHLGMSKEDASREVNLIFGDLKHPYYDQNHPAHHDEVARVEKLFKVMSGTA